ncbi:MAG: nucleotidyltransferase [Desulfobacteraceae bacterium]|jgi:predicted nucleotidyltransferase
MDTEKLLKLLNEHEVDYVIIGATAFPVHGYSRATLDIDLLIKPTKKNAENIILALKKFGYDIDDVSVSDILSKKILIRQYILETDIHPFVKGVTIEEIWENRISGKMGDVPCFFASLDDLIKMKKAAGRAKDKEDLKFLLKIKDKKMSNT